MRYNWSMRPRQVTAAAFAMALSACGAPVPFADAVREPREQAFEPPYDERARGGDLVRLMDATLGGDQESLTVTFVGGKGYLVTDGCSEDYVPWVGSAGEVLEVAIARVIPPARVALPENVGCTLEGYTHTYRLRLSEPFDGATVDDLGGGSLWVAPPPGLAMLGTVPAGWALVDEFDEPFATPSLWARVYRSAGAPVGRAGEAGTFVLYQAFEGRTQIGGGDDLRGVRVNGAKALLIRTPETGELILQWEVAGVGLAIVANEADFSIEELVRLAESAELPRD